MNQKIEYFFTSDSWKYMKIAICIGLIAWGTALCFSHKVIGVGIATFGYSTLIHKEMKPQVRIPLFLLGAAFVALAYFFLLRGYGMDGVLIEDMIKEFQSSNLTNE